MSCKFELPFTSVHPLRLDPPRRRFADLSILRGLSFHFSGFRASCLIKLLNFLPAGQPEVMPYLEEMNLIITTMHDGPFSRMVLLVVRQISMGSDVNHKPDG